MIRACYLAYPIDQGYDDRLDQLRAVAKTVVAQNGGLVYDPGEAFTISNHTAIGPEIEFVNRAALSVCDAVVAFLPKGVPSIGVPMEVQSAIAAGRQTLIFSDTMSWALGGLVGTGNSTVRLLWDMSEQGLRRVLQEEIDRPKVEPIPEMTVLPFAQVGLPGTWKGDLPTRGFQDDAGLDLYVNERTEVAPGTWAEIPTGIACQLPEWSWGQVAGRSSALKRGLLVKDAVIDAGYRGELFANVWNLTSETIVVEQGERVAQLIVHPNLTREMAPGWVEALAPSERGTRGFGSTGR